MFEHLSVNESSGMPVWVQIRDQIYFQIKSGQVHAGDVLPTVRELAVRIGVNYNTVHKVYQDLEADGLILSGRGRRSRIAEVDNDELPLPDSPVDVLIHELIRVAKENNVAKDELSLRIAEVFEQDSDRC